MQINTSRLRGKSAGWLSGGAGFDLSAMSDTMSYRHWADSRVAPAGVNWALAK